MGETHSPWLTLSQAARYCNVSKQTMKGYLKTGILVAPGGIGVKPLFTAEVLDAFIQGNHALPSEAEKRVRRRNEQLFKSKE